MEELLKLKAVTNVRDTALQDTVEMQYRGLASLDM